MPILKKISKENSNKVIMATSKKSGASDGKSFLDKFLGEVSKASATKQLALGSGSGFITGFMFTKVGKVVAVAVGGGIILLQVANENGYIKIHWSKVNQKLDKLADEVEEKITGAGPSFTDKMERYIDRKIDSAEGIIRKQQKKANSWYSVNICGQEVFKMRESYIFITSFVAGLCLGIAAS